MTDATSGQPIAGVTIAVSGSTMVMAQTDASGTYQINGLSPGLMQITAVATGYDTVIAATQLQANTTTAFSPKLYPQGTSPPAANTAGVSGTVVDSTTGLPLSNVVIVATTPDNTHQNFASGSDGSFVATGLTQDQVALSFSMTGYVSEQLSTLVAPLKITLLDKFGYGRIVRSSCFRIWRLPALTQDRQQRLTRRPSRSVEPPTSSSPTAVPLQPAAPSRSLLSMMSTGTAYLTSGPTLFWAALALSNR